ncbi:permease-like cell division protein FtsX [Bacillus shivajii]|uniref:cell division protein FtsX n=1 Tax=Bacillus shivajii TaxID=1983719 RepID=UPI001CFBF835|nr:permease-like cell division protein FtsX [Bacillus shivajii]UCZ54084.1 permease-like cell division protein FtsX [Bacillus shivajii]
MNLVKYYLRDAKEGIQRNIGASLAAILLIFISLTITGSLFLLKSGVDDTVDYLDSYAKVKIFVDPAVETESVAEILDSKSSVQSVEIETREEMLDQLEGFFDGREHLFTAFHESDIPDTILLEFPSQHEVTIAAEEFQNMDGITDVVYAQEFAEAVQSWSDTANRYGLIIMGIFMLTSFLTVSIAINLSLYQRQKDIRVKLLLGGKESHVRGQFLFEGAVLGFIGSLLASLAVYVVYYIAFFQLQLQFGYVFNFSSTFMNITLLGVIIGGTLIGLLGSYLSTRKMIKNA